MKEVNFFQVLERPAPIPGELSPPKQTPVVDQAELECLREFFDCWMALHALGPCDKRNKINRDKHERAAQRLVDAAESVKLFGRPTGLMPSKG